MKIASNSAQDYIYNFRHMMDGTEFTRTNNAFAVNYYLKNIYKDYGKERLESALIAVEKHFIYYESLRKVTRHKERAIYTKYKMLLQNGKDGYEQQHIMEYIKKKKRKELLEILNNREFQKKEITIHGEAVNRDNYIISIIKKLRGYKCQVCGHAILQKDGSYYIEGAHIEPSYKGGKEIAENIILLCPNHHKEFDLGNCSVENRKKGMISLNLNGIVYTIDLSLKK